MTRPTSRLRELLRKPGILSTMGAHDVLSALLIEQAGFEALFVGGFGTSASLLGLPDLNFLTLSEMADQVRRMCSRISIPLIADGDTGHGDLPQVQRTVREFESAGAAGVILEDQVAPKRCGHFEGKQVIPAEEMVLKIRVAKAAQKDHDFIVIGRTDAREVIGLDEAIHRANLMGDAGADVVFVEAPGSLEELRQVATQVRYPLLVNMLYGGKTPILSVGELSAMGYKISVAPIESLLVTAKAIRGLAETLLKEGLVLSKQNEMLAFSEIKQTLGVDSFLELRNSLSQHSPD